MINTYVKKPIEVQAIQFIPENLPIIEDWLIQYDVAHSILQGEIRLNTLDGIMQGYYTDYIIKGIADEFYLCKSDIFRISYELVKEVVLN